MQIPVFVFSLLIFLFATENYSSAQSKYLNYGFKIGLNALSTIKYDTYYAGDTTSGSFYTNKNGYLVGAFFRVNYSHLFLQPEVAWNYHQQTCGFMIPDKSNAGTYLPKALDINMDAVNTNLLLGYSIIKNKPFLFDVYIGTSLKWTYNIEYEINEEHSYHGKSDFYCYAGVIGFSAGISKLYFDFRYELNQPNTNLDFRNIPDISEAYQGVFLEKNENILSFSVGMMF
ncbi:MAG: PorT family protein [Candidatus Symbiothrix sp.]|jgi:hypothetical protein|nr:PorT family protein [Candidatus Symbiothrix sp.]